MTLYHGDCLTEHREWLDADVLITDPPYGIAFEPRKTINGVATMRHEDDIKGDKDTAVRDEALAIWGGKPFAMFGAWRKPLAAASVRVIWDKGDGVGVGNTNIPWRPSTEEIYIGGKWPKAVPLGTGGGRRVGGIIRVPCAPSRLAEKVGHPTPKPLELMSELVARFPEGVVSDPFAGGGSTLVAVKSLGRKAVGVELEERYCEIIAKRLSQNMFDYTLSA